MTKKIVCIASICLLLISCKGSKTITGSGTADTSAALKSVIASHMNAEPDFETLAARVQVGYDNGKSSQRVAANLRMEKDKNIWIKASFLSVTLAKVHITPTRVRYYESIGKTYFDGDFELLSEWLGTEIDFEKAQAILLGQSIFNLEKGKYGLAVVDNTYRIQPNKQIPDFITSLFLRPDNFKVSSGTVQQPSASRRLVINYEGYQEVETQIFPSEIKINASEGNEVTELEFNYKKIDLNVPINFHFEIPDGYTEIRL